MQRILIHIKSQSLSNYGHLQPECAANLVASSENNHWILLSDSFLYIWEIILEWDSFLFYYILFCSFGMTFIEFVCNVSCSLQEQIQASLLVLQNIMWLYHFISHFPDLWSSCSALQEIRGESVCCIVGWLTHCIIMTAIRDTVECCYNVVQYNMIFYITPQWLVHYLNWNLFLQQTPHTSP